MMLQGQDHIYGEPLGRGVHPDDAASHDAVGDHVVIVGAPLARWSACRRVMTKRLTSMVEDKLRHSSRTVTAKPIHKVVYPLANWGLWPETNSALEIGRVGPGLRDIARLHRQQPANPPLPYPPPNDPPNPVPPPPPPIANV